MPLSKQNVVFIPDESANVSSLLKHRRIRVNGLSDLTLSLEFNKSVGLLVEKIVTCFGNHYLNLWFLLCAYIAAMVSTSSAAR